MTDPQRFTVPTGSRVYLGDPAQEPQQLLDAIGTALAAVPAVREARRVWAAVDGSAPGLVIGIEADPDDAGARRAAVAAVAGARVAVPVAFSVNVVFVRDRGEFVAWMAENTAPFYRAKKL